MTAALEPGSADNAGAVEVAARELEAGVVVAIVLCCSLPEFPSTRNPVVCACAWIGAETGTGADEGTDAGADTGIDCREGAVSASFGGAGGGGGVGHKIELLVKRLRDGER